MPSCLKSSLRPQSPFNLKAVFLCFAFAIMLPLGAWTQSPPPFDAAHASSYFEEARRVSEKDDGKLWGQTLYGPILFVDQHSRAVSVHGFSRAVSGPMR